MRPSKDLVDIKGGGQETPGKQEMIKLDNSIKGSSGYKSNTVKCNYLCDGTIKKYRLMYLVDLFRKSSWKFCMVKE